VNVLDQLPKKDQPEAKKLLQALVYANSRIDADNKRDEFGQWCMHRGYSAAADTLERDWERMVTFYDFPAEHWKHLRTTNPVESPFAFLRLRTDAARRFKKVDNAVAVIWKLLMVGEKKFRTLSAANLLKDVYYGARFEDGLRISTESEDVAA
jgi:transposase-like protein